MRLVGDYLVPGEGQGTVITAARSMLTTPVELLRSERSLSSVRQSVRCVASVGCSCQALSMPMPMAP